MKKFLLFYYPDSVEPYDNFNMSASLEECLAKIKNLCELHYDRLRRTRALIWDEKGKVIIRFTGRYEKYELADDYKDFEPLVLDIYDTYFKNARSINPKIITTAEELRNTDVIIKGYTTPQDYDYGPDYSTKCKVSEAYEILKHECDTWPEEFYNLQFDFWTRDEVYLFCIRRDLETIHLGRTNKFNLTKDMITEALGNQFFWKCDDN